MSLDSLESHYIHKKTGIVGPAILNPKGRPEDSARELNDSVYGLDNIADQIMIWSLVLAALCAAGIITIIIRDSRRHSETIKRSSNADDRFARLLADDEQIRQ